MAPDWLSITESFWYFDKIYKLSTIIQYHDNLVFLHEKNYFLFDSCKTTCDNWSKKRTNFWKMKEKIWQKHVNIPVDA